MLSGMVSALPYSPLAPFAAWAGSRSPRMVIVGEAWGESEAEFRTPFAGQSGMELFRMLGEAMPYEAPDLHAAAAHLFRYGGAWIRPRNRWLDAVGIGMTNVLALRPPANALGALCGKRQDFGQDYPGLPPLGRADKKGFPNGPFLRPEFLPELDRLLDELATARPNVVVAAGNTACWAVLQATNIGSIRGATAMCRPRQLEGLKVLPTYHPAGVLRQWSWRPIVVADLMKAWREAQFPELRRPQRQVLVNPTLEEIARWVDRTLALAPASLAVDVETGQRQIKCIGFARSRSEALVVPFVDFGRQDGSYWVSAGVERAAREQVQRLLASGIPLVFQNGLYDLQYILGEGFTLANCSEDTMLLHHSLFPELQKGLGFLGSIYTSEASWKLMRRPKADTEKRDE